MRFKPTIATRIAPTENKEKSGGMQSAGNIDVPLPDAPDEIPDAPMNVGGVDIDDLY